MPPPSHPHYSLAPVFANQSIYCSNPRAGVLFTCPDEQASLAVHSVLTKKLLISMGVIIIEWRTEKDTRYVLVCLVTLAPLRSQVLWKSIKNNTANSYNCIQAHLLPPRRGRLLGAVPFGLIPHSATTHRFETNPR